MRKSGALSMTKRFGRLDYGSLEIEITVEDPKAYTKRGRRRRFDTG
jgi:hypothetical protein